MNENLIKNKRKIVKAIWISTIVIIVLIIGFQVTAGVWLYNKVEDNGGIKETLVDVVKAAKQIDKESEVK